MVVTTASKLILAEDEVKDLREDLENMKSAFDTLEAAFNKIESLYDKQFEEIERLRAENAALKYDKSNPWWKFW